MILATWPSDVPKPENASLMELVQIQKKFDYPAEDAEPMVKRSVESDSTLAEANAILRDLTLDFPVDFLNGTVTWIPREKAVHLCAEHGSFIFPLIWPNADFDPSLAYYVCEQPGSYFLWVIDPEETVTRAKRSSYVGRTWFALTHAPKIAGHLWGSAFPSRLKSSWGSPRVMN